MPIYNYECPTCGVKFEGFMRRGEAPPECPNSDVHGKYPQVMVKMPSVPSPKPFFGRPRGMKVSSKNIPTEEL